MAAQHKSARGIAVDMERLRLANETAIAVGNMKVNARGDQLGPGGKVIKTRAQVLADKNKLHGNLASDDDIEFTNKLPSPPVLPDVLNSTQNLQQVAEDTPVVGSSNRVKPRGSFAESVAKEIDVTQELLDPKEVLKTPANQPGIKRI